MGKLERRRTKLSEEKRGLDVFCRTGRDLVAVGCSLFTDLKGFVPLATSGLYQLSYNFFESASSK